MFYFTCDRSLTVKILALYQPPAKMPQKLLEIVAYVQNLAADRTVAARVAATFGEHMVMFAK